MIYMQINPQYKTRVDKVLLKKAARAVLNVIPNAYPVDLTIVVGSDENILQLNQEYRHVTAPTDVLAFPSKEIDPVSNHIYIGDIIISYPRVVEQSGAAGHSEQSEVQLLVIHGILHLLNFDHDTPENKSQMWKIQSEVLNKLGHESGILPDD
jgi:probable rRNA maturation factor